MPIEIKCPNCAAGFRAPDKFAGKRVKCPKCQGTIAVPVAAAKATAAAQTTKAGATAEPPKQPKAPEKAKQPKPATAKKPAAAEKPAVPIKQEPIKQAPVEKEPVKKAPVEKAPVEKETDQWYVQTDDDEQYGPVSKDELHEWITEGRLDASCQVLCEGWEQWKWAEEVFDELGKAAAPTTAPTAEENPFAGIADVTPSGDSANPFESPQTISSPTVADSDLSEGGITPAMCQALAQTRPWVLFFSILGFVIGGFGVLGCLGGLILAVLAMTQVGASAILLVIMALVSGSVVALYVFAAYFLFTYASQIAKFLHNHQPQELERALLAQKSFWKLVGMVTAIGLGLDFLLFLIAILAGGFSM